MEANFNKLFDNFNNCLQPDFPDNYTRNVEQSSGIRKITDIFNNKNDTEIANIIKLLRDAQENFYINRAKILEGKPRLNPGLPTNHPLVSEERAYLTDAVEKSLEYQSIGDAYISRINYLLSRHIHSMYGVILGASGFIDTVPKYLECHIELYENILQLKLSIDREKLSEMKKFNNLNYIVSKILELKKQIKLETSPDMLKIKHIQIKDLQKRLASLIKIKDERQDQQVKEEYETLQEDPQVKEEEEQRLRKEVQGFISGGKKNKKSKSKSRKSKSRKSKSRKSKSRKSKKNKSKRFRI